MKNILLVFLLWFSFGCYASNREMSDVTYGYLRDCYLKVVDGYVFNSDAALLYLEYLAGFKDFNSFASPFAQEDELLIKHLAEMKDKEKFWLGSKHFGFKRYLTCGCVITLSCAIGGVFGSLYAPTLLSQACSGVVGEGSATYCGYYATGILPREVSEVSSAVQQMKQEYINNYNSLALYLLDCFELPAISKKFTNVIQVKTLAEGIAASLPILQKRFLEKTCDRSFVRLLLIPLSRACGKILNKDLSPDISSPVTPPPDLADNKGLLRCGQLMH